MRWNPDNFREQPISHEQAICSHPPSGWLHEREKAQAIQRSSKAVEKKRQEKLRLDEERVRRNGWQRTYRYVPRRCPSCRDYVWREDWWVHSTYYENARGGDWKTKHLCKRCYVVKKLEVKPEADVDDSIRYGTITNITAASGSSTFTVGVTNVTACTSYNMFWEDA